MSCDNDVLMSIFTKFAQFVSGNVDQNVCTLGRIGIFHGMGIIVCSTNVTESPEEKIWRLTKIVKSKEAVKKTSIDLRWHNEIEDKPLGKFQLVSMEKLKSNVPITTSELSIKILWHAVRIFQRAVSDMDQDLTGMVLWRTFLQPVHTQRKSTIMMLALIDLNPNDLICIYSTLLHVIDLAFKMNIPTPSITFDQPLWVKTIEIVQTKKLKIVVRFEGFHSLMSFIGSIGMCMEGSGLEKLLMQVYSGNNVVSQMMSGKAISSTLRGLYLVDSVQV